MRRSKLEMYIDTLLVLYLHGPLKLTHIMNVVKVASTILAEQLDFLVKQNLVEKHTVGKRRSVYAVTERGITVLNYFKELKQVLPVEEETQKQAEIP